MTQVNPLIKHPKGHLWYGPEWGFKRPMGRSKATTAISKMKVIRR